MHAALAILFATLQGPGAPPAKAAPVPEETAAADQEPEAGEAWLARVDELAAAIESGKANREEADALYPVLFAQLRERLDEHGGAIRKARSTSDVIGGLEGEPGTLTIADLYATFDELYEARTRLLAVVTPRMYARITGIDVEGVENLELEIAYVLRHTRYQRLAVPEGLRREARDFRVSPLPLLRSLGILIVGLFVFRGWRKWARKGLRNLYELVASTWPEEVWARGVARVFWNADRVRRPLEWLALSALFFSTFDFPEVPEPKGVLNIVLTWLFVGWFAVVQVDALATRASSPWKMERSPVRMRSLGVVATWLVFLGLGLHLAVHLTGEGTIYVWVFRVFELLAFPMVLTLVWVWKPEIKKRMEHEALFSPRLQKHLALRKNKHGFVETTFGMAYLLAVWLRRTALKLVRKSALGRTLVAEALRQSMVRGSEDLPQATRRGFSDPAIRNDWLYGKRQIDSPIAHGLERVRDMQSRGWPLIAIVAERGGGKSSFLRRVVADYGDRAVLVELTHGSAETARVSLGAALGIEGAQPSMDAIGAVLRERSIRVVAWDDMHHLSQPVLGGQAEIDHVASALAPFRGTITLVASVDSAAWQYMSRVREARVTDAAAVELPAWTEGQIGELIEARAEEMGIELSYHRLTFPRMLLESEFSTPEEGLRASFRRLLWSEADGNPFVAMRLLADALIVETDGRLAVQLPKSPSASELDGVRMVTLLVLRFILQTDGATMEELVVGLRYPADVVRASLLTSTMRGWIEEREGRHYVTWDWYRTITRVLVRNNFLASAREGVESSERDVSMVRQRQTSAAVPSRRSSR